MALAINGTRFYGMSFGCRLDTVDVQLAVRETEGGKWEARSAIFETGWRDVPTCESFSFIPPKRSIMLRPVAPPAPRVLVDAAAEHGLMWTAAVDRDKWPQCVPGKADVGKKPDVGWHVTARLTTRRRICLCRVLETKVLVPAIVPFFNFDWRKFDHFQARALKQPRDLRTHRIAHFRNGRRCSRTAGGHWPDTDVSEPESH